MLDRIPGGSGVSRDVTATLGDVSEDEEAIMEAAFRIAVEEVRGQ